MMSQLLVLSSNAMLLLDQRTLSIKYRIPVQSLESISLSPFHDTLVAFHLRKVPLLRHTTASTLTCVAVS